MKFIIMDFFLGCHLLEINVVILMIFATTENIILFQIVHSKIGVHNRVTKKIRVQKSFSLSIQFVKYVLREKRVFMCFTK